MKITKAVFPVAGLGSRFLPVTKASPKEMLPVVDKPLIQYAVEEAAAAGITDMIFITGRNKRAIEDHFDKAYELETELALRNKSALLECVQAATPPGINCIFIRQTEALGLGHAVLCAAPVVGNEPFAVLLADDLIDAEVPVMKQMVEVAARERVATIGVMSVDPQEVGSYGIVETAAPEGDIARIVRIVEKPKPGSTTSTKAVVGRYVSDAADLPPPADDARRRGRRDPADRRDRPAARRGARRRLRVQGATLRLRHQGGLPGGDRRLRTQAPGDRPRIRRVPRQPCPRAGRCGAVVTLNELRYIVAVAQERSFGRAAGKCFVSQPALSVAIQKLEEELGAPLFERGKSEITVTPVGERIVEQAQRVLEEASRIKEIAQSGRNQLVGTLRLGVIYTVAPYLLPDLIPALHELAPQMPLDIEENLTEHLEGALKSGRIDAAIVALPFDPPGIVTTFLYEEPFQVVVPQGHKWAKRKSVHPDELATEHTILLNVGHCFRDQVLDRCPELNRADAHVTRTNSLETVRNMVASGLGISVLPHDALTPKYHSRLVVPVPFAKPAPSRRVALAARKSFPRPQAIEAIRTAVAACRSGGARPRAK